MKNLYRSLLLVFIIGGCLHTNTDSDKRYKKSFKNELGMTNIVEYNKEGLKDGKDVLLYSNGSLCLIMHYKEGDRNGRMTSFYPPNFNSQETSVKEISYFKYDRKHGKNYGFYSDGTVEYIQKWENGNITGTAYYFDTNGRLHCCEKYGANRIVTSYVCFDSIGRVERKSTVK